MAELAHLRGTHVTGDLGQSYADYAERVDTTAKPDYPIAI
jgi:hypothetical protein